MARNAIALKGRLENIALIWGFGVCLIRIKEACAVKEREGEVLQSAFSPLYWQFCKFDLI